MNQIGSTPRDQDLPEDGAVMDDSDISDTGTDGESVGTADEDRVDDSLPADDSDLPAPDEPL